MPKRDEGNAFDVFGDESPRGEYPSARFLFDYEKHYAQLLSEHRGDIEFIADQLKDLRDEQDFLTDRIAELNKKLDEYNVNEDVKNLWLKHLTENLSRSIQLSIDLASHYMIMEKDDFMKELQKRVHGKDCC